MARGWLGRVLGNEAATRPAHRNRELRGRRYAIPFQRVWSGMLDLIADERPRWRLILAEDRSGIIELEAHTRVFGFVDDVEIRIGLDRDAQTRVHVRSSSRVGKWDLGTNGRRIRRLLRDLDRRIGARPRDLLPPLEATVEVEPPMEAARENRTV